VAPVSSTQPDEDHEHAGRGHDVPALTRGQPGSAAVPPDRVEHGDGQQGQADDRVTVPLTTGGKNRISLLNHGAIKNVTSPATITAP
jgi:hypothetical protein